jgi:hypothetical protein
VNYYQGKMMKYLWASLIFLLLACSHQAKKNDLTLSDEYWDKMIDESHTAKISIIEKLKQENPKLFTQMKNDSADPSLLMFWGVSLNSDGGINLNGSLNKQIVESDILLDIHHFFGLKNDSVKVHAGITHTYGYLFSRLITPYGFKRKRWTNPTLNYAFGLKHHSLAPSPDDGSLLSNLTYLAGKLSFRNKEQIEQLDKLQNVSEEVKGIDYKLIKRTRLVEKLTKPAPLNIVTSLVKFAKKMPGEENDYLLIYTLEDPRSLKAELITAFPIKLEAYQKIINPESLGEDKEITFRYNAYKSGFVPGRLKGSKAILEESN